MAYKLSLMLAAALATVTAPAFAQDEESSSWSVTITPRYQKLFFLPNVDADGLESMDTYGGSIAIRPADSRFGVMATYLTGNGKGTYTYSDDLFDGDYDYRAKRREFALTGEFNPSETNITFLLGYHHFKATENETLINPDPGDSETNAYRSKIDAAEVGLRLASAIGRNSSQSISAQFMVGVGKGRFRADERFSFTGGTDNNLTDEKGAGYIGDIALGYNIFLTDNLSVGARGRGYVYYVDVDNSDPIFAVAPELNLSIRF